MVTFIKPVGNNVEYGVLFTPLQLNSAMHFHIAKEDKAYGFLKDLFKLLSSDLMILTTCPMFAVLNHMGSQNPTNRRERTIRSNSYAVMLEHLTELIAGLKPKEHVFIDFSSPYNAQYWIYTQEDAPHIRTLTLNKFMLRNGI